MTQIAISKASSQLAGLLTAVGLEQSWGAVSQATDDQLASSERDSVLRESATMQLGKASDMVKTGGLTAEVVQLLQLLVNLMAGMPGLAPGQPAAGTPESAPQAGPEATAAAMAPPAPGAPPEAQAKDLPPPRDRSSTAPLHDDPENLPPAAAAAPSATAKDLPAAQRDPDPSSPQTDPQPGTPRADNVRGSTGGGGKEGGDSNPLPSAQSDAQPSTPQKDPLPSTPTRKAGASNVDARTGLPKGGGWWNSSDIGRQAPKALERPRYNRKIR